MVCSVADCTAALGDVVDSTREQGFDGEARRARVGGRGDPMAWSLDGTYFENCSCDTICPCTWSGLTAHATHDRCKAMLAFHIDRGNIEGVDVSGLTFAMVVDSPPIMSDGGWAVGVLVDDSASDAQREKLGAVLSGQLGGPPAMLGPLIGDMRGMDFVPTEYSEQRRAPPRSVRRCRRRGSRRRPTARPPRRRHSHQCLPPREHNSDRRQGIA